VLLGGVLTGLLSWQWIFLVNVPIGIAVLIASRRLLPAGTARPARQRLDIAGALLVTAAVVTAVYAVVGASQVGWLSARTEWTLAAAVALLVAFVAVESRTSVPLMPLRMLRRRNLTAGGVIGVLWSAAMFACFFLTTLYLQLVLHYSPLQTGLAFLPMNLIMGGLSAGLSARLVGRLGIKPPLVAGLLLAAAGLALLGRAPVGGHFVTDVLPGGILLGIGAGMALSPLILVAIDGVPENESGLASGMVNTCFMLGGALGLAVLAGLAASSTRNLLASGHGHLAALAGGYHAAFLAGAASAALAALLSGYWLRPASSLPEPAEAAAERELAAAAGRH
jgi:MFS family permease